MHKHRCDTPGCHVIWQHDALDPERSHRCPVCGAEQYERYQGSQWVTSDEEVRRMQETRRVHEIYRPGAVA